MKDPYALLPLLAVAGTAARREALKNVLSDAGLKFAEKKYESEGKLFPAVNIILEPEESGVNCPLFCAHYDAYGESTGANDNAAAAAILINLALTAGEEKIPAAFAFFDGEETGHSGAKHFDRERKKDYTVIVNLDMCGYGDTVAVYTRGSEKYGAAKPFCDKERLKKHGARLVKYLPESDDICFSTKRQPVLSIAAMPKWDTKYLDAMAAQGSGLLGRTPEFKMMLGEMEVATTMHGGFRDDIRYINPETMRQVYSYLYDCLTAGPAPKKRLFGRL